MKKLIPLQRHILEEKAIPQNKRLELALLFWDLMIAIKKIHNKVTKAGLVDILGQTGEINVQGEEVKKLDEYANEAVIRAMNHGGHLCAMASEEVEDIIPIPSDMTAGKYVLAFDPLDGSANIDINASVGTIFSVYERRTPSGPGKLEDIVRPGREQVLAGYVVYGSSTMLVYTVGAGLHGFTFDPEMGEFYLSRPNMKMPQKATMYSVNEGKAKSFPKGAQLYIEDVKKRGLSGRNIGCLVADFHRDLIVGGIFMNVVTPQPKLRLIYEVFPAAWLAEQAGGAASTGTARVLDITASELHQRVPFVVGNREEVERYEKFIQEHS